MRFHRHPLRLADQRFRFGLTEAIARRNCHPPFLTQVRTHNVKLDGWPGQRAGFQAGGQSSTNTVSKYMIGLLTSELRVTLR